MNKEQIKHIITLLTMLFFIGSLVTGLVLIMFSLFVKGISYQPFLGITKKEWYNTHLWMFTIFAVLAIIHSILNFKNLTKQAKHVFKKKKHPETQHKPEAHPEHHEPEHQEPHQ